jgi:hypothetical protein
LFRKLVCRECSKTLGSWSFDKGDAEDKLSAFAVESRKSQHFAEVGHANFKVFEGGLDRVPPEIKLKKRKQAEEELRERYSKDKRLEGWARTKVAIAQTAKERIMTHGPQRYADALRRGDYNSLPGALKEELAPLYNPSEELKTALARASKRRFKKISKKLAEKWRRHYKELRKKRG